MNSKTRVLAISAGVLLCAVSLVAQTAPPDDTGGKPSNPGSQGAVHGKGSAESELVRGLLTDFKTKRDAYIAERKALVEKLKGATDAERKQILADLRAEQQSRIDDQRALAKQIRDELKKLREQRKSGSGG
jgi:hypothetical protein